MKRQQLILIFLGVLMAAVCLGTGWFLFSAMLAKNAAAEERNQAYTEVQGVYRGKVFPSAETIARVHEDQRALETWLVSASNLVHKGDLQVEPKSPTGFKQTLQATVRALSAHPGAVNGKVVASGFHFGFDKYLGQSDSLPSAEHVDRLTRQLVVIEMLCKELYAANILELKAVSRETFEELAVPGQQREEPQPSSRRRRRRDDEAASPVPAAAVREASGYFSKQRFTLEFLARPSSFIAALNRLAALELFVVVAETEFRKTDDPLAKRGGANKKKDGASQGGGEVAVDPATLTHIERLVTDPDLEPPVSVKLEIDVYSFEGV